MQHSCSHSNAICNHSFKKRKELRTQEQHGTTTRCRTQRRNQSRPEQPQPQPPHTRGTFHRRLQPLTRKNKRFRAPASSPKQSPCNIHAAIPLRSATTASRNAKNCAHRNNMEQPLVAERRGGTNRVRNDRSRNRRTHEVPFIAGCSHFTRKNTRFRAAASSPTHPPCNINATFPSYHFPSSPPFIKVSFFCDVLLMYCYVVQSLTPPFIKVNSFVMYCYVV